MDFLKIIIYAVILQFFSSKANAGNNTFDTYYSPLWGSDHLSVDPQGTEVQLLIDQSSGAGFRSNSDYGSGLFHIKMKIPENKTGGILTTFYLTSAPDNQDPGDHFELDFEFIGTNGRLKTNVFNNDRGQREQIFQLGFDPSVDFHTYEILWNSHQIVFLVDSIPIRYFRNNTAQGLSTYPSTPMHIEASIWNAGSWAGVADWSLAPFIAYYQDFDFGACTAPRSDDVLGCALDEYFWNGALNWELSADQKKQMNGFRDSNLRKEECLYNV